MNLTVINAHLDDEIVGIRAVDGLIEAIGVAVDAVDGDKVIDATGLRLTSGLINGHTHAAMTLFRSWGDDLQLMEWLETRIWPAEANLTADDVYWGTRLACAEMIRSGTVKFFDMYWHSAAVARAVDDAGLRGVISAVLIDGGDPERGRALRDDALASVDELRGFSDRVQPSLGPHAIYTVSDASLTWIAETAAEDDLPIHIHLSETESEVADCLEAHGTTPAVYLDRLGLLGPDTILAHGNWFTDDEFDLVAERGATVVSNPVSNMKLANGRIFPSQKAIEAGVPLGLGTDSAASNNNLDLFEEMKVFALVQKHEHQDPSVAPAHEVAALAAGQRSSLMGGRGLAVGEPADFILIRTDDLEMTPGHPEANLVYSAGGHVVDTTVVAGRVLMSGRRIADEAEIRAEVIARAPEH